MKLKFTQLCLAGIFMTLLTIQSLPSFAIETNGNKVEKVKEEKLSRKAKKARRSRNNQSVRIFPDKMKKVMHVVAKENDGRQIDFFVFDQNGTLMQHIKLTGGDHEKLAELGRGKYIYRVFSGDEESASGTFEMR